MFKCRKKAVDISPDEVFLDSRNIPNFDSGQFEGRMEKPIDPKVFLFLTAMFLILGLFLFSRVFYLQITKGEIFHNRAENNHLRFVSLFPERGLIYDRNNEVLVWNEPDGRVYKELKGSAHVVGYTGTSVEGIFGRAGVEMSYDEILRGQIGTKILEMDSKNKVQSEHIQKHPQVGESIYLSVDSRIQKQLYEIFSALIKQEGYQGTSGVIMDIKSGEILAMANYPEYNSQVLSQGSPEELIESYIQDNQKPFLNRAISGLYAPGSVVKPFVALAALNEEVISPDKSIFAPKSISIPNPYFPDKKSVFNDWKEHGLVDMRKALAVSSNVYFYIIGGGYEDIGGLGIKKIKDYFNFFGFGQRTGIDLVGEAGGIVPDPEFKKDNLVDPVWRVGDTYNISIGQANLQVTPLQMAVAVAILANDGWRVDPSIIKKSTPENSQKINIDINQEYFSVVKDGMRQAVLEGTARALGDLPVKIAAKTGTAQLGSSGFVNSWIIGFWPYDNPHYAFSIVLEKGNSVNLIGGVFATRQLMEWMFIHTPEYLDLTD